MRDNRNTLKLLIYPAVEAERLAQIESVSSRVRIVQAEDESTAIAEMIEADALFGKLTPAMLRVAKRLRWVQAPPASSEHYLFDALVEHPCELTNMRGLYSDVIADHVLGYLLVFARQLHVYLRNQPQGRWAPVGGEAERTDFVSGPGRVTAMDRAHLHLADATLGIVGLGSIGRETARRAQAFGMRVLGVDPQVDRTTADVARIWPPGQLDDLLKQSDFVLIAAPHTPQTVHMFGRQQFAHMKSSAILINVGRGAIVDLAALDEALEQGEIAGAALDVFEIEPLPPMHPLWRRPNVILTPHVAACSPRIAQRHLQLFLDNLRRFSADQPLENRVDKHRWY